MKATPPDQATNTSHLGFCSRLTKKSFSSILKPQATLDTEVSGLIESTRHITVHSCLHPLLLPIPLNMISLSLVSSTFWDLISIPSTRLPEMKSLLVFCFSFQLRKNHLRKGFPKFPFMSRPLAQPL